MSGEYSRWNRTSQSSSNSFCLVIKETCGLSWWKIMHFLFTNSGCFSSSAAFGWSNWEQYLLELILCSSRGAHKRGPSSNPTIYTTSPSLDEDQTLVWLTVVHFICPTISSIPHYCLVSTFHRLSQFILKMECFHYISVENHMWKYGQDGFSCLPYVQPKHQKDEYNQADKNDFQYLIWIFSVCRLSHTRYNVDCSQ